MSENPNYPENVDQAELLRYAYELRQNVAGTLGSASFAKIEYEIPLHVHQQGEVDAAYSILGGHITRDKNTLVAMYEIRKMQEGTPVTEQIKVYLGEKPTEQPTVQVISREAIARGETADIPHTPATQNDLRQLQRFLLYPQQHITKIPAK